ncbi:MAG: MBL fold metallo-hydrolase [Bacillota bacterium]
MTRRQILTTTLALTWALLTHAATPQDKPARETRLTFLGSASANPGPDQDTASFIINDNLLIDCGFNAGLNMQRSGYDPAKIETLFFTHCHHDHYIGLPGLLFLRSMRKLENQPPLQIVGPTDDLPIIVDLSRRFLQADRFPTVWPAIELHPLAPGATYETPAFRLETIKSRHQVTGFCVRFTDKATNVVIAFSGDTAPNPALAKLAQNADILIHEASISSSTSDDKMWPGHSRAIDAARTAREAGVKQLILIHLPTSQREASLAAARQIFPNTALAKEGQTIVLPGK